jgi:N-methylhydantoinase B
MDVATTPAAACDPITLEIVKGSLRAAQLEMETLIERTAVSPVIREKKDFFAGYFDPTGQLVTGTNLPLFGHIIQPLFDYYPSQEMRPGDVYWYNDCYASKGGVSHSPDQVFAAPVYFEGRLVGFAQSWAHFNDIGGAWPGSMSPTATDIYQEGIMIPPVRLYREGAINEEIYRIFLRNSRFPEEQRGDIRALIAAVRLGEKRFIELFERFGPAVVEDAFAKLNRQTRDGMVRQLRETFRPGSYEFADAIDGDGQGNGPFKIRMALDVTPQRIAIDATRTDDQAPGPVNFLMNPAVPRMIFGIYAMSRDPSLLINEGAMHAVDEVKVREGSLVQPKFPAPLNQRGLTMMRVQNVCAGLMNVASGGKSVAASAAYSIFFLRGHDKATGRPFLIADGVGVGHGARPFADGHDGVYYVAQENNPAEFLDQLYPLRLLRYEMGLDTAGPGRWRGGAGVVREVLWLGPDAMLAIRIDGIANPPWGVRGGQAGRPGRCTVNPGSDRAIAVPPLSDGVIVKHGDTIRFETCGGGGWGHPFDREAERVLADVRAGYVSPQSAREDYGVAIAVGEDFTLDAAETVRLRRDARYPSRMFHNGGYVEAMA